MKIQALFILLLYHGISMSSTSVPSDSGIIHDDAHGEHMYNGSLGNSSHGNDSHGNGTHGKHKPHGVHLVAWNFSYVEMPLLVTLFIVIAGLCKIAFHHAGFLSSLVPESCVLILVGTAAGAFLQALNLDHVFVMTPKLFMLVLLPPIVLDSAFSLHDRVFFENFNAILLFAVVGTVINFILIGPILYGLAIGGAMGQINITLVQCFVFSALIIAVDPVAVLAIFQEIGVNNVLYFLVFGESLLNDAVTVVLVNMMKAFNEMESIPVQQIFLGIGSFFTVSLGGLAIGIVFGIVTALITKQTDHVRVVEPMAIFGMAYLSYLTADMVEWSGIISMIGCGLTQAHFALHNIARKSYTTVKYFTKVMSALCDCIIFLFLGIELIRIKHEFHWGFIAWTIILCLLVRLLSVFALTFVANKFGRARKISMEEQFIMWYGGLRGAVCFALCVTLNEETLKVKNMFLTTVFCVIIFTVFIQGMTIKPLVKVCHIKRKAAPADSLLEKIDTHVNDHIMAGVEGIIHQLGNNALRQTVTNIVDNYLKPYLLSTPMTQDDRILACYEKIYTKDHYRTIDAWKRGETAIDQRHQPEGDTDTEELLWRGKELEEEQKEAEKTNTRNAKQKWSSARNKLKMIGLRKRKKHNSILDPTVDDLHQLLSPDRTIDKWHNTYDKNLTHDTDTDLMVHLREKHRRMERHRLSCINNPERPGLAKRSVSVSPTTIHENPIIQRMFSEPAAGAAKPKEETSGLLSTVVEMHEM